MIIAFPHKPGHGGPGSFQQRFEKQLKDRGHQVCYARDKKRPDMVFVVGGTGKVFWLILCKLRKTPIIYRLDGINWLHKVKGSQQRSFKNYFRSEIINKINLFIHDCIADFIVYQSAFVSDWWRRYSWVKEKPNCIINNGVDLNEFTIQDLPAEVKIVCLEGALDYSPYAISVINSLHQRLSTHGLNLEVYGEVISEIEFKRLDSGVNYKGLVKKSELPGIYSNSIYVSLDINAACPNTVIEALACGAPVVGYNTGSLKELLGKDTGELVFYNKNIWDVITTPNVNNLVDSIIRIYRNYSYYSRNARKHAEGNFDINVMTNRYLEIIESL